MMKGQSDKQFARLAKAARLRPAALAAAASLALAASAPLAVETGFKAPVTLPGGQVVAMPGKLCRPASSGSARLVLLVHGTDPIAAANRSKRLPECGSPLVWWFASRGYAVAAFLRPGYGDVPGPRVDITPVSGSHIAAAAARADAIAAAIEAATALPGVRPDGAVVVGGSTGGFGAVAYDSLPHPKVIALVNFAGGQGGHCPHHPGGMCDLPGLLAAARTFGVTATTPMLWVYAANDSFFPPEVAGALAAAFGAGGSAPELHIAPAFAADGHYLSGDPLGSAVWGPLVADYLARMGATP